jgi:Domain of unknown function (DUF4911)
MFSQNNDSPGGRQGKIPPVSDSYQKRSFHVPRQEIAYLRFIVEAYDGLLFLRTLDAATGMVEIAWPTSREEEAAALLAALAGETGLHAVSSRSAMNDPWP